MLLTCTDLALVEIALQTGLQNQPHFTTVFKKITALTPRKWRGSRRTAAMAHSLAHVFDDASSNIRRERRMDSFRKI